jgi:hypothetical protein
MNVCPGFWDWIAAANRAGIVYSISAVQEELKNGSDLLASWARQQPRTFFLTPDKHVTSALATVSNWATSKSYKPAAISEFFSVADYWLVGHALATGYILVTHEVAKPSSKKNIKLPDACNGVDVKWTNPFEMLEKEGALFVLAPSRTATE